MLAEFFADALRDGPGPVAARRRARRRARDPDAGVLLVARLLRRLPARHRPGEADPGAADLFGAHTYQRVDRDGKFHIMWGEDGREVEA